MMSKSQHKAGPSNRAPSVWAKIRTGILVTFLTVLIWFLAESRMVQTRTVEIQIVLLGNTQNQEREQDQNQEQEHQFVVRPAPDKAWVGSIDLELEGSLASLDQATRQLRGSVQLIVGDQIPARPGIHDLDLRAILRNISAIRSHGVSVRSISTDTAHVQVDQLSTIELPVRVDLPSSVVLDGSARVIPQTVTVQGPSSLIEAFDGRELIATPPPETIASLSSGQLTTISSVPMNLPSISKSLFDPESPQAPGWTPILTPSLVDVRLTIRSLTQITTIDRLPVQVLLAPGEVGRWNVVLNPGSEDLVSIQISGPTDALTSIIEGTIIPSAVLSLSFQDLERSITSKQITLLGLPSGVEVLSELPEVGFEITRTVQIPQNPTAQTP